MKSVIDYIAAEELKLYADNTYRVYVDSIVPTRKALSRKLAKGIFDKEKAVKAFEYCAAYAAKLYCQEFGGIWYQVFNKATREETARNMVDDFVADNE